MYRVYCDEESGVADVIPDRDIFEHTWRICRCEPVIQMKGEIKMYIHNSFDAREYAQQGINVLTVRAL